MLEFATSSTTTNTFRVTPTTANITHPVHRCIPSAVHHRPSCLYQPVIQKSRYLGEGGGGGGVWLAGRVAFLLGFKLFQVWILFQKFYMLSYMFWFQSSILLQHKCSISLCYNFNPIKAMAETETFRTPVDDHQSFGHGTTTTLFPHLILFSNVLLVLSSLMRASHSSFKCFIISLVNGHTRCV